MANVSPRTIWRILLEVSKVPCKVALRKPLLTKANKEERIKWSKAELRKGKSKWEQMWFVDEVNFSTKVSTGGPLVRIPEGADRSEEKYQRQTYSNPTKVMGPCGFNDNGQRFMFLLEPGERMNSGRYVGLVRKVADNIKRS